MLAIRLKRTLNKNLPHLAHRSPLFFGKAKVVKSANNAKYFDLFCSGPANLLDLFLLLLFELVDQGVKGKIERLFK